jgi:hypothetical protein
MRIAAVTKARALGFIEIDELNRNGRIRLADVVPALVKRYGFLIYPTKIEDFDVNDKGMTFGSGRLNDIVIDELKIYSGAIYAETLSSTDDSRTVLLDILEWGANELELTYTAGMIKRWAYVSDITFYTDFPLLRSLSSPLDKLARKTGDQVTEIFGEDIVYHPMNFVVGHDPRVRKHGIAGFTIQQRVNTKFDENKYFSEAPLPTAVHLKFLAELEEDVKKLLA